MNDQSHPAGHEYLRRARALAPILEQSIPEIERARRLTPAVVQGLVAGGFYRMLQPHFLGGGELSIADFAAVIEEIAKADASTAWCLSQCAVCAMSAAYLDRPAALQVFGPPDGIVAWGPVAASEARMVEGGYRVTGSWNFASGGHQASWLGGQSFVYDANGQQVRKPDGSPLIRMMLFPYRDAHITDVWDVMGLRGTGSDTYAVKDLFVPEALAFGRDEADERREGGALFKFSTSNLYSFGFAAVALGVARRVLDEAIKTASAKTPGGSKRALRDNNVVQAHIGRSEAMWRSARSYLHTTARDVWQSVSGGAPLSPEQKIEIRLAATWTIHQASDVVDTLYHMLGSTVIFQRLPFERRFRDIHTITQQLQGRQSLYENVGQVLLGLEPDALLFTT